MRYILGLKSSIDSRSGGCRIRELDFVRLVLAVRILSDAGSNAHGYVMLPDEQVASRVRGWQRRYSASDLVSVLLHSAATAGEALRAVIRENEPGVEEAPSGAPAPLGLRWDYFGIRNVEAPAGG